LKRGWLGTKLGCLSAKAAVCGETRGGCFKRGKVSWRERVLGSGEMAQKKNKVIASRACIERCAGLKLQILVTEITACLYICNKQ